MPLGTRPRGAARVRASDIERFAQHLLRGLDGEPREALPPRPLESATAVDFHVHVVDPARNLASLARLAHRGAGNLLRSLPLDAPSRTHAAVGRLVDRAAELGPSALTALLPVWRKLPPPARSAVETLAFPSLFLHTLARGFHDNLVLDLDRAQASHAVVIAHEPLASSDYVLDLCARDPRLFAVVTVPVEEPEVAAVLRRARDKGAVGVKLHACALGCDPDGAYARALVDAAADLGLFVVIHTGRARLPLYKDLANGDPRAYVPHFDRRTDATFVLAHMNLAEPEVALDVARRRPNVCVDTSWQGARDVKRAVGILGAERVLVASDWPFGGGLIARSIREVEGTGLSAGVLDLILRRNAIRLLGARRRRAIEEPAEAVRHA